jgi:hypothetical protein
VPFRSPGGISRSTWRVCGRRKTGARDWGDLAGVGEAEAGVAGGAAGEGRGEHAGLGVVVVVDLGGFLSCRSDTRTRTGPGWRPGRAMFTYADGRPIRPEYLTSLTGSAS